MGRIVVNKHFDVKSNITPESFAHKGEIIISNQVGFEGIFIKNNNGEIFYIAPTEGTSTDVPLEYKEYIESFVNGRLEGYVTRSEFENAIKNIQIDPAQVRVIANEEISSALGIYSTTEEVNEAINQAINAIELPSVTTREIREIASEEIVKIVNSADSRYDTLKEISDWILNDTTGAASMANDIQSLKAQLNALTLGAKATASVSKSSIYVGEENRITVTGRMEPNTLSPCTVSIYKGSDLLTSANTYVVTYTEVVTGTTTYIVQSTYNGTTYTASTKVNAYYPTYYGFGVEYGDVLNNKKLLSSAKRTYTDTARTDGVYYYILVPDGVSKPSSFTMGGAPFNMNSTNETINGVNYTIFKSGSIFNNGGSVDITAS